MMSTQSHISEATRGERTVYRESFTPARIYRIGYNRMARLRNAFRGMMLKLHGAEIGPEGRFGPAINVWPGFVNRRHGIIKLGEKADIGQGVMLHAYGGSIEVGNNVTLGPYCVVYGHGGVSIGDESLIAMHCRIVSSNHHVPGKDELIRWQPDIPLPVKIGRDVWLGAGATVLGGVEIGDGCVVAAGAVVSKSIPPYSIAMGVPAKVVRSRD